MSETANVRATGVAHDDHGLPTGRELRLGMLAVDCIVSIPALAVMIFYILTLIEATSAEWRSFAIAGATYGVLAAGAAEPVRRRFLGPLFAYLNARNSDEDPTRQQVRQVGVGVVDPLGELHQVGDGIVPTTI